MNTSHTVGVPSRPDRSSGVRHRELLKNLLTLVVSSAVCFGVLEGALRVLYGPPPPFIDPQVRHRAEPYGYKPLPNQRGVYTVDKPVRTNRYGFRDDEWSENKPAGTVRVLVIGDSFTFGNNNLQEDVYPQVLERMLRSRFGQRVEVLNASAAGWDLDNEQAFFEREGIRYQPDVVVLGFFLNDLLKPRNLHAVLADGRVDARPVALRWIPYRVVYLLKRSAVVACLRQVFHGWFEGYDFVSRATQNAVDVASEPRLQQGRRLLAAMVASCRAAGATLVIAALPPVNFFLQPRARIGVLEEVERFARDNGVSYVDVAEPFWRQEDPVSLYGYPWDNHFIAAGHGLAARALYEALATDLEARLKEQGGP